MRRFFNFLFGAIIGAFVGAATAILLAPVAGEEFQDEIRERFSGFWSELQDAAEKARTEMEAQIRGQAPLD